MRGRTVIDAWCRTLGNYSPVSGAVLQGSRPTAGLTHEIREIPMALKLPRQPNPNIALLDRRRALRVFDAEQPTTTAAARAVVDEPTAPQQQAIDSALGLVLASGADAFIARIR